MLTLLGYMLGFAMGMILGVLGAGGSILTVPILVYCFDIEPLDATGYSLLVVGLVALSGALRYWSKHMVNLQSALQFSVPAMLAVLYTRSYLIPSLPDPIIQAEDFTISKDAFILILFGLLMLTSSVFMFNRKAEDEAKTMNQKRTILRNALLVICCAGVGMITGLVGAGGGFIIVPILVGFFNLPMKTAIGTSLMIIAINSLVGFNGDLFTGFSIDWKLLTAFLATTFLGMWLGTNICKKIESVKLSKLFAAFTFLVGISLLGDQTMTFMMPPLTPTHTNVLLESQEQNLQDSASESKRESLSQKREAKFGFCQKIRFFPSQQDFHYLATFELHKSCHAQGLGFHHPYI